jgi:hypothetical protein
VDEGEHGLKNVGAGLLANAVVQFIYLALTHGIREQARSHTDRIPTVEGAAP